LQNIKEYFNIIASKRKGRGLSNYYWKEITNYCNYFSHEDSSVLEIGCGSGDLLAGIAGSKKTGIDFSEGQIAWAKEKHAGKNIEFILMDANHITLTEKYDFVVISNLIGFVDDIQSVFEQVQKVCHPNTKIIVQYYNSLWEPALKFAELIGLKTKTPLQNWLNTKDVNNLLFVSGFDVYRNSKRFIFPFYIPLIAEFHNLFLAKFPFFRFFSLNTYSFAKPLPLSNPEDYKTKVAILKMPLRGCQNLENTWRLFLLKGTVQTTHGKKFKRFNKSIKTLTILKLASKKGKEKRMLCVKDTK
jgi:ubiquinone/menaquinone biosynthesis C-methylase UbiE